MESVRVSVRSKSKGEALEALREKLWGTIFSTGSGKDVSALAKRWLEVSSELGDKQREPLEAIRDRIAEMIDASNSGRDIASLSIRLMEVIGELDALPDAGKGKNPARAARERVRSRDGSS